MMEPHFVYEAVVDLISKKPKYVEILQMLLKVDKENETYEPYHDSSPTGSAWEMKDTGVPPPTIGVLARKGIAVAFWKTNKYKVYCLAHPKEIEKALAPWMHQEELGQIVPETHHDIDLDDLFSWIIGYDEIKKWTRRALSTTRPDGRIRKPVHVALKGPAGSAKSAFLLEIARLKLARMMVGSGTSKVGIFEVLYDEEPFALCIDEFEKQKPDDYSTLYSLMADGFIQKDVHHQHLHKKLPTRIFGALNSWRGIPNPIRSRFKKWDLKEYTKREYMNIVVLMLPEVESADPEMARKIAEVTSRFTTDIREAIRYERLCDTIDEVDELFRDDVKYLHEPPTVKRPSGLLDYQKKV